MIIEVKLLFINLKIEQSTFSSFIYMLNIPIIHRQITQVNENKISLLEKFEYKQELTKYFLENNKKSELQQDVWIAKNDDGTFKIIVRNINYRNKQIIISLNNKLNFVTKKINTNNYENVEITSKELNDVLFKDVFTISVAVNALTRLNVNPIFDFNQTKWVRISELSIKITREQKSNNLFFINEKGIDIETYSRFIFIQRAEKIDTNFKLSKIKLLPVELITGSHNENILKIEKSNQTATVPLIVPKTIEGLKIADKKQKLKFELLKEQSKINNVFANIIFDENTYYSFENDNTYVGVGENSKKGYIIPYKFKGDLYPLLTMDIGFGKGIIIGYSVKIDQPYFNKYSGKIKLKIADSQNLFDDSQTKKTKISNSNFSNIILDNLSLEEIMALSKDEK